MIVTRSRQVSDPPSDKDHLMRKLLQALRHDERGVTALEYVILGLIIVTAVAVGGGLLQHIITSAISETGSSVQACIGSPGTCGS